MNLHCHLGLQHLENHIKNIGNKYRLLLPIKERLLLRYSKDTARINTHLNDDHNTLLALRNIKNRLATPLSCTM